MVGQISTDLGAAGMNINDMLNRSRDDIAVTLLDLDRDPTAEVLAQIGAIPGVLSVRCLGCTKDNG